jgi:uncharacterized protein YigE (DUF2233 family)
MFKRLLLSISRLHFEASASLLPRHFSDRYAVLTPFGRFKIWVKRSKPVRCCFGIKKPQILNRMYLVTFLLLMLVAPGQAPAQNTVVSREVRFENASFLVVDVDLQRAKLELHWRNPAGNPFLNFQALEDYLTANGQRLQAVMNAGIFDTNSRPLGLHIERGQILRRLNSRRSGYGNFYLQPNGVFYLEKTVSGTRARLQSTVAFERDHPNIRELGRNTQIIEATQSGPMLVVDDKLNSAFKADSGNRLIRNAIGVQSSSRVVLVLTETPVNFHTLARFMRDQLECPNALYLDGNISNLYVPGGSKNSSSISDFGGMITVLEP